MSRFSSSCKSSALFYFCSRLLALLAVGSLVGLNYQIALSQQATDPVSTQEPPLIDQAPFDLITLKQQAGGQSVKVAPLPFPDRRLPARPTDATRLEVVLLSHEDRRYEVAWGNIEKIELYEQLIYQQALQKMAEKDFVTAFQNLSFLMKKYSTMVGLERLREEFLFNSATTMFTSGKLLQTFSTLEELRRTAPDYESAKVLNGLSRVTDTIIKQYVDAGDFSSAQQILQRLIADFGDSLPSTKTWKDKLQTLARSKQAEAASLIRSGDYRGARKAAVAMLSIFPDLEEANAVFQEINRLHPSVRVGTMQSSDQLDPASLINWPGRRAGKLVYRSLFEFLETGSEGGRYGFALGSFRQSDDRQQLTLSIDENSEHALDAYAVAQLLLERADPEHPQYDPSWAAIVRSVTVHSASQLEIQLQRPNVLPQALLQWYIPGQNDRPSPIAGPFRLAFTEPQETGYRLVGKPSEASVPIEIVERFYDDPKLAVNDLLRGEIDVLDQLFPADANRLSTVRGIRVGSYALPTVHMLIPVSDYAYLARDKFKRALLYATDRQSILTSELLNSDNDNDGRLVSGPFPIGSTQSDPLSYAYDPTIEPPSYNPRLAKLLLIMVDQELAASAQKLKEKIPEKRKLIVATPDFELARVAVQALIQQWMLVGVEAEMTVLPRGQSTEQNQAYDLVYVAASMWEPATDIERLLGGNGPAKLVDPYIVQGLSRLRAARNWREVRNSLQDLHRLVDYHLPVLPLWQITDRFAVSDKLEGLENGPVTLYQNIQAWRISHSVTKTAARP